MRKSLFLLFFLSIASLNIANAQECIVPEQDMEINEDTLLCKDTYNLEKGVVVSSDGIFLDCNGASLYGNGLGYGIMARGREGVTVRNCNITNFEAGIYLDNSVNNNIINNYLSKNRFGIVLFSSENNNIKGNVMEGNLRNDEIEFSPVRLFEPIENETETVVTEPVTPINVFENAIKIRNPGVSNEELAFEIENVFNKYFNLTNESLELSRIYIFNESEGSTRIILRLVPKVPLLNLSVYENIPKCMSSFVGDILFESSNFEVIEADPLIIWNFTALDAEEEIFYKVFRKIDEECKQLLRAFGIATGFGNRPNTAISKNYNFLNITLAIIATIIIVITFLFFVSLRKKGQN